MAVTVSTSDDMNKTQQLFQDGKRTGRGNKSVFCHSFFVGKNFHLLKFIMRWLTVYGGNVMAVQHMYKWCREFDSGRQYNICISGAESLTVVDRMWRMNKGVVSLPCLLILFRILMQQCKHTDVWVLLNWNYGLIFLKTSCGTLFMNVLARGKCAPGGFLIIWLMNMKDTHGVIPDSSSTLQTAWWSILTQNCYRRWDLGLWLHSREQGCITDLEASLSSQKEVQDSAVSRKSDGHCLMGCLWSSVGWFHPCQFSGYLSGNSKKGPLFSYEGLDSWYITVISV